MNMGYICTFTGDFPLNNFPFDYQELKMDIRLNNKYKDQFNLSVHAVLFHRKALTLDEWTQLPPTVERHSIKERFTNVSMTVKRNPGHYIVNIVAIMAGPCRT
jgi:hypothetical protein